MTLYEFGPTRSTRARWTLQELGIPFEAVRVNLPTGEHRRPEFLRINPAGRIPVLVDGDLVVRESVAIVVYLAEKYPEKRLLPTDARSRAEANQWLLFTATELEQPLWRITRNRSLYPEHQRQPTDILIAGGEFKEMAAVLERHMQGRAFVVGDRASVVDFVTAYTLDWAGEVGLLDGFPNLTKYVSRMYARPKAPLRIAQSFAALRS